ncbi:NADH dehydrogenase [ubiquinone] 1 alpha subcomplex subunit 9, mitochondrial [Anthophora quadrimaculata]
MAALIPKILQGTRNQNVYAVCYMIQSRDYSSKPYIIKNPTTANLKRGTGGRSSFSGKVCTVFGCSGFIGSYLCIRLGRIGSQVILPYRCDPYHIREWKVGGDLGQVLYHPFDLRDEESLIKCMKYSNVVINLIGANFETNNFNFKDVNVEAARKLARLAKECNVERFIHLSCLNAAEKPTPLMLKDGSKILQTKWEGEQVVREEFPEATIIRPSVVYGQRDKFLSHYLNTKRKTLPTYIALWKKGKETEKQPIHVRDVVSGIVAIMNNRDTVGKTYQFVGPKRYKLDKLVEWLHELAFRRNPMHLNIVDIKYEPLAWLNVYFWETIRSLHPAIDLSWEVLEYHHTSDKIDPALPTLEDLGVTLTEMESVLHWEVLAYADADMATEKIHKQKPLEVKTALK